MYFVHDGIKVNYSCIGQGQRLILLHGWGGSAVWTSSIEGLVNLGLQVFVIDFPGFGGSENPNSAVDSLYYAKLVQHFVDEMDLNGVYLLGHSFGGKVAILANTQFNVGKGLILVDSAGFKRTYPSVVIKKAIAKLGKIVITALEGTAENARKSAVFRLLASDDYFDSGIMQDSFKLIVNEDIRKYLPDVSVPTLVMWGEDDNQTPLIDGVEMHRLINCSELKVFHGAGHFSFLSYPKEFFAVVGQFLSRNDRAP